jgi:2,3-bisphosphoglycerate-dependent phosphoglycerate mutase
MTVHFITLLRHGESEGNSSGVLQGQEDYPLTRAGVEQAKALASIWKSQLFKFDLIISSPLKRASQTAEIISRYLKIPIEFDPAWKERNYGKFQGTLLKDIEELKPSIDFYHPYQPIGETGESQVDLFTRACLALQNVIRQPDGTYLIISHGGILNRAMFVVLGISPQGHYNSPIFHFSNAGYAQLRYNSSSLQWAVININNHLPMDNV